MTRGQAPGRLGRGALALLVLLTGLTLALGYVNKTRCVGPEFDESGRSQPEHSVREYRDLCYSDIPKLWLGRDIDRHVFPYVHGSITPEGQLAGGAVEYPVLTGLLIWLGALGASTDAGFLAGSALLLAPFGLVTGWLLGRLAGWRALLWALGPPLFLYGFHNWDLAAVACAVGAVFVVHDRDPRRPPTLQTRATIAAVLLGLGFALKLYPGAFVLPLALYVLTRGRPPGAGLDVAGALRVGLAALGTVVAVNLPFMLAGYAGWRASITFQQLRSVDLTTNSIWYWGVRPLLDELGAADRFPAMVDVASPALVLAAFAAAVAIGLTRRRPTKRAAGWAADQHNDTAFPWVGVSAAMLCGFLLLHKVHSPQYALWLLPFFVLLRVRAGWIVGYLLCDVLLGLGIFRLFYQVEAGQATAFDGFAVQAVVLGVWGRAVLLAILFVLFLRADAVPSIGRGYTAGEEATDPAGPTAGTGSSHGRSTERTTSTQSSTTKASRTSTAPRNHSGGSPLASDPT